ncbi:TPA: Ferredoxin-1, chloroplastic [Trebouxia sp. C0004]
MLVLCSGFCSPRAVLRHDVPRRSRSRQFVLARASKDSETRKPSRFGGLGDLLGPIGLTLGGKLSQAPKNKEDQEDSAFYRTAEQTENGKPSTADHQSIHEMSTEEWRAAYEQEGCVDLWVEEEFNSGSRLMGGRSVHKGGGWGIGSGEGPSISNAPRHTVKIFNHHADQDIDVEVPEDRFILWEAEEQGLLLPYACRMGCCTACAVRVKEGVMSQPEALGISKELKDQGFALMCVGYPKTDLVLETVEEDEIYDMQFGHVFAEQAVDPRNKKHVERDDFALEVANMDE